ncbi:hypothetical protein ACR42A_12855 [Burkholderia gladioli]|uniref:hypothetical protein n=1 Tax=Burkholderia gladioli TaxID=28095 RepID=UPI001560C1B8|nr:hypothetical protein [Burkholderia gladioli]NRF89093.1 hypothetical protein [Burkholderia gladioli]
MNPQRATEALAFAFTPALFKGLSGQVPPRAIVIGDLALAFEAAFEQNLPVGQAVWLDVVENWRGRLREHAQFDEAHEFVGDRLGELQQQHASAQLDYRKKKVKKVNTARDDFQFSDAREDAYFVLSTIAIHRYLDDFLGEPFFEDVFALYRAGGWPCGMKDDQLMVFDPDSIA